MKANLSIWAEPFAKKTQEATFNQHNCIHHCLCIHWKQTKKLSLQRFTALICSDGPKKKVNKVNSSFNKNANWTSLSNDLLQRFCNTLIFRGVQDKIATELYHTWARGMCLTSPLTTVLGDNSPTSTCSTYRLSASGCFSAVIIRPTRRSRRDTSTLASSWLGVACFFSAFSPPVKKEKCIMLYYTLHVEM